MSPSPDHLASSNAVSTCTAPATESRKNTAGKLIPKATAAASVQISRTCGRRCAGLETAPKPVVPTAVGEHPVGSLPDREQHDRRTDGDQEAAEVEVVAVGDVQNRGGDEAADQRADHPEGHGRTIPRRWRPGSRNRATAP